MTDIEEKESPLPEAQQKLRDMIMSGELTVGQVMHEIKRGVDHYCANRSMIATNWMWKELESDESWELEQSGMMQASVEIAEYAVSTFKDLKANELDEKAAAIEEKEDDGGIP